jgi:hypothetical protein
MKFLQSIFLLIAVAMVAALIACSSTSTPPPPPPPPVVAIAATGGTPQSTVVGTAFASSLVATVTTGGSPTSGATVTFTAPGSGASGTFANGTATEADTTDASGKATSSAFTANATAGGPYSVTASVSGATSSASFSLTNTAPAPIAVTIGPAPASLPVSTGAGITAFVANDAANAGVTWTVTCGSAGACGTFSAASALSGVTTDFSAPAGIPTGNTVTVTATSVTDPTKTAQRTITVTSAITTLADGTYVFSASGEDAATTEGPYFVAGAFVVSGGSITSGEQDFVDLATIASDSITGGSVSAPAANGNVTITLTTGDASVGVSGVETFDAALVSSTRARIIEFDSSGVSSGRVDQQSSTSAPSAGYAFFVTGVDGANSFAQSIGGVINIDGSGTISGTGSVFDINDGGSTVLQAQSFAASTVSTPDGFGRVVFALNPNATISAFSLVGYIVDPSHIRLVETTDTMGGTMGGVAIGQGATTGTFSSISGNSYVAGLTGFDANGALQAAGVFTANADGSVSGAINYNDLTGTPPTTPSPITGGTYTVDVTGRVTMTGVTDGTQTFNLQIYLTGTGLEAETMAITVDATDVLAGIGWQQTGGGSFTASSFFGSYVLDATGADLSNDLELDAVGPVTADGVGALTGSIDYNSFAAGGATVPVTGAFVASADGAFTGTITGLDVTQGASQQDVFVYYLVDTTKVFAIETDTNQLTLGFFTLQQ